MVKFPFATSLILASTLMVVNSFTSPQSVGKSTFVRGVSKPLVSSNGSSSCLSMKNIAVIGASGLTAAECVYQALKNGDTVVGLTRCV